MRRSTFPPMQTSVKKLIPTPNLDFRHTAILLNQPRNTNTGTILGKLANSLPVFSPNHECEYLMRIGSIQIDESWLFFAARDSPLIGYLTADRDLFTDVIFSVCS